MSKRAGEVPINFQSFLSFSLGSLGISSLDAAAATLPNVVRLPEEWVITPFAALHSAAGTPHSCAAAATSISRAAAPAWRTYSCESRMPRLPPVDMSLKIRLRRTCSFTSAYSGRTLFQSHSSSSATSCASPVKVPCPSSERAMRIATVSSGWITIQCVTSGVCAALSAARAAPGSLNPITSAPVAAAVLTRNSRRPISMACVMALSLYADLAARWMASRTRA